MLGAIAVKLLQITESSKGKLYNKLNYKSGELYITTLFPVLIAAIVGHIYFDSEKDAYGKIVYFHTGASSPLLIRTLSCTLPAAIRPKK